MEAAAPQNIWLQLAAPLVTLSTALLTLAVNSFRDFSSLSRRTRIFELEKKRLEYWKLHQELSSAEFAVADLKQDLVLSATRVGRLADEDKYRLRRVLGEAVVVLGLIGSITALAQKASDLWPGLPAEWKTGLAILATSFTFLLLSFGLDFVREIGELVRQEKEKEKKAGATSAGPGHARYRSRRKP